MYIEAIKSMQKTVSRKRAGREYNNLTPDKQTNNNNILQTDNWTTTKVNTHSKNK